MSQQPWKVTDEKGDSFYRDKEQMLLGIAKEHLMYMQQEFDCFYKEQHDTEYRWWLKVTYNYQ